ncbi:MAG: hypothetical protein WD114_04205 [Phycisphaerales bacterium]
MSSQATTGHPHTRRPLEIPAPAKRPAAHQARITPMTLTWSVARRAIGDHAPQGRSELVHLNLSIDADARSVWSVRDPQSGHTKALNPAADGPIECTTAADCLLIRGPHIYAFVRLAADSPQLLYARTTIFQTLNIPGGRYQVIGVEQD